MFRECKSLESIDMLTGDMNKIGINDIKGLFACCSSLKNIKMNFDSENNVNKEYKNDNFNICFKKHIYYMFEINKKEVIPETFEGLPENGIFI